MKVRALLASVICGAILALAGQSYAQTGKETTDTIKVRDDLKLQEQKLLNQFKEFEDQLHRLKRRLSVSKDPDDRAKAQLLEKVIEKARDESIIIQFEQINSALKEQKFTNISEIRGLLDKTNQLATDLQELVALMKEDPNYNRAKEEAAFYKKLLEQLDMAIKKQRDVQIRTDLGKADPKELKHAQEQVTKLTGDIAKAIDDKAKGGEGGEGKNPKGESKPGESKGEGKSGESKEGGKEGKAGESKGKEGEGKEGKGGDPKEGKEGEGKKGEAKGSEGKGDKGAEGKGKAGEGAESKSGAKSSKGSEGAAGAKAGAGKEGDKKEGGSKDGGEKGAVKEKENPGEAKAGDPKDKEAKSGESKSGEGKAGEGKPAGSKESKGGDSKGEPKAGSKGSESKGESKGGEAGKGESKPGQEGSESKSGAKGSPPGDKKNPDMIGKKQVQDAEGYEKNAEKEIEKKKLTEASDEQGKAIAELEKAKKKLEDLLKQAREEELERLLAALQARCEKMLAMQIRVYNETVDIHKVVQTHVDKTPDREDKIRSLKQAKEEQDIVLEATKAIQMLEAEGTAVAFPEVFQQVREDMKIVQRRLELADVATVTQAVEQDIIDTLREMVEALKKAREENKDKKDNKDGKSGESKSGPQDQKLLDQIAELKMIRSMQVRVNTRTTTYGRMYVERDGEQARDPNIRRELQNLSERQERITEVTGRIAKGDNR